MGFISRIKQTWERLDESWRFAITAFLIARSLYALWSWVILTVQPVAVHYIEVDDEPSVLFLDLHTTQSYSYVRNISGNELTFRSAGKNTVTDLETDSIWNIYTGRAVAGYYKGDVLTSVASPTDMFSYFRTIPYPNPWLALWQRFDTNWYISIAEYGYGAVEGDFVFPPLYPILIRLFKPLIGNTFLAGLFISHILTLYALKLLCDLFTEWKDRQSAQEAVVIMLLHPVSFFLFSAYTEALFLVLALLSINNMKNRVWHWAGFWTFCAILARLQGIALLVPMLYLLVKDRPFLGKIQHWAGGGIAGMGFVVYLYLRSTISQNSAVTFSEERWHSNFVLPWEGYLYAVRTLFSGQFNHLDLLNWAVTTACIVLLIAGWRRIPIEYSLYVTFSLIVMLTRLIDTKPLNSMLRYSLTLFPIFFVVNLFANNPSRRRIIAYTCLALNLYLSAEFFGWGWVA